MKIVAVSIAAVVTAIASLSASPGVSLAATCAASPPMTFAAAEYVDTTRAGGEPIIATHPSGRILYGAHAGSTHFYGPAGADENSAAFVENYTGQTYMWHSDDNGATWEFAPRTLPDNAPLSGFSDPDFAIDAAGQVYLSEINLINVAMSKSEDRGATYKLQNFFAEFMHDRQWSEADEKDVVYLTGNSVGGGTFPTDPAGNVWHTLYKSTDGGQTFSPGVPDGGLEGDVGLGDLRVDPSDGTLYEAHYDTTDGRLSMASWPKARSDDLQTRQQHTIAMGVGLLAHWPSFDLDPKGNLYITWDETGRGAAGRAPGIYYSYSTDRGRTWAKPIRVDGSAETDIWPWLAVGDEGRVGIAWLEADVALPQHNADTTGTHGWNVMAAQSLNGLGCDGSAVPGFTVVRATSEPVHRGTICQGGTFCQALAIDRRLGDYFSVEIDGAGRMMAAYSDTRQGGAVSLPGFARQSGGPSFFAEAKASVQPRSTKPPRVLGTRRENLASTGVAETAWIPLGALLILVAVGLRRWSRPA